MKKKNNFKIAVIGLGYVGLPLAIEFGKEIDTVGYDINSERIKKLKNKIDTTREVSKKEFKESKFILFSNKLRDISSCNVFIITVPTPITKQYKPDLSPLKKATNSIAKIIKKGDIVIYESTVYPGITEKICGNIINQKTNLILNKDFLLGYSPERINPGDKKHTISKITKIISGSNLKALNICDFLYTKILGLKTHKASSIMVAEAAKVIENAQRDINIAFMNELSIIFDKLNINTNDVLRAANTKWNFNNYTPGLVGGHCIGVDPYYLAYLAQQNNYVPKLILAGRNLNESMPKLVVNKTIKLMKEKKINTKKPKILIMGLAFKEDCTDIRNSKSFNIINLFLNKSYDVEIYDPIANIDNISNKFKLLIKTPKKNYYDAVLLLVKHKFFISNMGYKKIKQFGKKNSILFDLKSAFKFNQSDGSL